MQYVYFSWIDYTIFAASLCVSVMIGVAMAVRDRNEKSLDNYYLGNRKMHFFPVGLSLAVSCLSSLTMMGFPVEVYLYGTVWFWNVLSFPLVTFVVGNYFIPVYCKLDIKCMYEYLELRFNKKVRIICSIFGIGHMMVYMPTATYYPALALSTVTQISTEWSLVLTVTLCTLYTVIGGFKSVVWTDTIQAFVMLAGSIALLVYVVLDVGGVSLIMAAAERGNRSTFHDHSMDIFKRCTPFGVFQLGFFDWMSFMGTSQFYVQRFLSCKSEKTAKRALYTSLIPQSLITALAGFIGMGMYAFFENCDPLEDGRIDDYDKIVPYILAFAGKVLPGINGLFVAAVYSGTLSTISSGINSLTVMIMEDLVGQKWKIEDQKKLKLSKVCGILIGVVHLAIAYLLSFIDGTVFEISMTVVSCFASTVAGIFILGIFTPWANTTGTIIGAIAGFSVNLWLTLGSLLHTRASQIIPVSTDSCNTTTSAVTFALNSTTLQPDGTLATDYHTAYDISFVYTRMISLLVSIPIGILVSFATGPTAAETLNPDLFMPLFSSKLLPENIRKFWRFGVAEYEEEKLEELQEMM